VLSDSNTLFNKEIAMRTPSIILAAVITVVAAGQPNRYVMPTERKVGIYQNRIRKPYEQLLYRVGPDARLLVLEETGRYVKVKDGRGRVGWVEKRLVTTTGARSRMLFAEAEVVGYLGNPTPIIIFDANAPDQTPLYLDRSFDDEVAVNVDRETIERSAR
jgi:hypothetical protein